MFCAMINASDPTFHLFCEFKYPPSCFCVCWKMKMQIRSMKQVNFVNSSIHYSGLKYPPSCFSVYLENKNAYLKQETSEIIMNYVSFNYSSKKPYVNVIIKIQWTLDIIYTSVFHKINIYVIHYICLNVFNAWLNSSIHKPQVLVTQSFFKIEAPVFSWS